MAAENSLPTRRMPNYIAFIMNKFEASVSHLSLILASLCVLTAGCGKEESESYSYDYTSGRCTTGSHTFSSKTAYCDGLVSDKLNNGCAKETRKGTYTRECGGDFDAAWARVNRAEAIETEAVEPSEE
jgi:hypothetical protein